MSCQIEVDFEVIERIWAERISEGESDNAALKRLLHMPTQKEVGSSEASGLGSDSGAWVWKGVSLPTVSKLQLDYLAQHYEGEVRSRRWWIGEQSFTTPSEAAKSLARTREGRRPSLDGWKYRYVKRPGDTA